MNKKNSPKPQLNKAMRLLGSGIQMGTTIYLFVLLGKWLDQKYNQEKTFLIICTLFGVFSSLYLLIRQLNKLNK